ncbi:MAG: hypothetical protein FJZ57_03145 [Chlamydiae bacterium]|nr:hypothetical protein [Chlamydiota bacterium]
MTPISSCLSKANIPNSSIHTSKENILYHSFLISIVIFCALRVLSRHKKNIFQNNIEKWVNSFSGYERGQAYLVASIVNSAHIRSATSLKIKDYNIRDLPQALFDLTKLRHLEIEFTNIKQIPPSIQKTNRLVTLFLENSQLEKIPQELEHLTNLTFLSFKGNRLKNTALSWDKLTELKIIDLSFNQIQKIPKKMTQIEGLEILRISGNKITKLFCGIFKMKNLIHLQANQNRLSSLPSEAFEGNLCILEVSHNKIRNLAESTQSNNNLELLNLSNNEIQELPISIGNFPYLSSLLLRHNQLRYIPSSIGYLRNLQHFDLSHNSKLHDLPLSCIYLTSLSIFDVNNTSVSSKNLDMIFDGMRANHTSNNDLNLKTKIKIWATYAEKKPPILTFLIPHELAEIQEWLLRLETTKQFQGKNKQMAQLVIDILTHLNNEKFKKEFFNEINGVLSDCEDKALMTILLINLKFQLLIENNNSPRKQLDLITKASRTILLLKLIAKDLITNSTQSESTQVFLYFLATKSEKLGLLLPWDDFDIHYREFTEIILTNSQHQIIDSLDDKILTTDTSTLLLNNTEEASLRFIEKYFPEEHQNLLIFFEKKLEEIEAANHTYEDYIIKLEELKYERIKKTKTTLEQCIPHITT